VSAKTPAKTTRTTQQYRRSSAKHAFIWGHTKASDWHLRTLRTEYSVGARADEESGAASRCRLVDNDKRHFDQQVSAEHHPQTWMEAAPATHAKEEKT
jgi:hypothetical protein